MTKIIISDSADSWRKIMKISLVFQMKNLAMA